MSILIKGMEMPTSCADCKLRMAVGCCGNLPHNTRMPNCPIAPIPPHGDLIERNALIKQAQTQFDWNDVVDVEDIANAPTIIPAEEG